MNNLPKLPHRGITQHKHNIAQTGGNTAAIEAMLPTFFKHKIMVKMFHTK